MAGLNVARLLKAAGEDVTVFDKGRGLGGRCATRRAQGGLQFDHGAQYVTAKTEEFAEFLEAAAADGAAATWGEVNGKPLWVGKPGMSALAKYLARDLEVRQGIRVQSIRDDDNGVSLETDAGPETFDRVICTAPAPQSLALLPPDHELASALSAVRYDPCIALMVEVEGMVPPEIPDAQRDADEILSWITRDSSKSGRPVQASCWVAQASPAWSAEHLELSLDELAEKMLPEFCSRIQVTPDQIHHRDAHRWRYAAVTEILGQPFLISSNGRLMLGGDWCLGARVEAAFISGAAMAEALLAA